MKVSKPKTGSAQRMILTGMITNRRVLSAVASRWEDGLFPDKFGRLVGSWCVKHYEKYGKPPGTSIQNLYDKWSAKSKDADTADTVSKFLSKLSDDYETRKNDIKADFVIDEAQAFFKAAQLRNLKEALELDIEDGEVDKAIERVSKFNPVQIDTQTGVDIFSAEAIKSATENPDGDILIRFPDAAGAFFGDTFSRGNLVSFAGPEKSGKCVSGDMEIVLSDGSVRTVKSLMKGKKETVLSFDESEQRFVKRKIEDLWTNGKKTCYKVTTRTGREIETTSNHKYLTPTGWKDLKEIKVGEYIAVPKRLSVFGTKPNSEELIKFLSYMLAEGCTTQGQGNWTNTDPILIKDFLGACKKLGISWRKERDTYWLSGGQPLYKLCKMKGCSAKTKTIPDFLFTCPKKQIAMFLRILFSCDGCILRQNSSKPMIELTLANKKLVMQIQSLLTRFGIVSGFCYKISVCDGKEFDSWRLTINDNENVALFLEEIGLMSYKKTKPCVVRKRKSFRDKFPTEVARRFYDELETELEDTEVDKEGLRNGEYVKGRRFRRLMDGSKMASLREQLQKRLPIMRQSFWNAIGTETGDKYLNSDILWDAVASIENVGKKETFDLTIPDLQNFVANNVVVHNTFRLIDVAWRGMEQGNNVAFIGCGDMTQRQMMHRIMARYCRRPFKPMSYKYPKSLEPGDPPQPILKKGKAEDFLTEKEALDMATKLRPKYGNKFRLFSHANSSISALGIRSLLVNERKRGWVPDCIIIDYADIIAPMNGSADTRDEINATWKMLRNISHDSLVVTATQTKKESYEAEVLTKGHFSEDKRKNAHVNVMIGINVTDEERETGMSRLNLMLSRENEFSESKFVYCSGSLAFCDPIMFSSF